MTNTVRFWQRLSVIIAGMLNKRQKIIEYLKEENRILRAPIGLQRRRITAKTRRGSVSIGKVAQ